MWRHTVRCACLSLILGASVAAAQPWSARADFTVANGNPNGAWSYGSMPVGFGVFTPFVQSGVFGGAPQWYGWGGDRSPSVWYNLSNEVRNNIQPGELSIHPGPGTEPIVVRWTAPATVERNVRVTGFFGPGDSGSMTVAVRVNNSTVWTAVDKGSFDLSIPAVAGDTIDFTAYAGYYSGNTVLDATITLACVADFNADGFLTFEDFDAFVAAFEAGSAQADFDDDGFLTFEDFDAFVAAFESGC